MRSKPSWIAPLLAALLVACVGWWGDLEIGRAMRRELTDDLRTVRDADVTALEIWMINQKRIAEALAEEPRLRNLAVELLARNQGGDADRPAFALASRQLIFGDRLQQRLTSLGYTVAQLVDTNFEIVLDSGRGRSRAGTQVGEDSRPRFGELFASGDPVVITPFKTWLREPPKRLPGRFGGPGFGARSAGGLSPEAIPLRELTVMQVAAAIKDTNGVTRGALALIVNPDAEFTRILSVARSGETGETFAFDPEGVMISRSRFEEQLKRMGLVESRSEASSALTLRLSDPGGDLTRGFKPPGTNTAVWPLMEMIQRATNGGTGVQVEPFRDYRGVPVIGAWTWLPNYGFGVATKLDADEAFRTVRVVRGVFVILFLLLVLASLAILLFSVRQRAWHRRLTEAELKARQLGQYKLVEKIGQGAMGVVYKAQHALLRRDTALKLLMPDRADAIAIQRFEREVRLTCRLRHPNTIQVYDYGFTPEGIFYYAMEYLDGLTLAELVERYGPQPEARVIHLVLQIAESLAEAHSLGLVHRDIKPANVFVCDRGGVPDMVKVLDFGLVRTFDNAEAPALDAAESGLIIGTPVFMAPEALQDSTLSDARSDLYSLGALGYYLLTGQHAFDGETILEICQKRLREAPVPPSARLGRPLCAHLEALILRCLEKEPADRPQSAPDLIALLAAGPHAAQWTLEQRAAWWSAHREAIQQAQAEEAQPLPGAEPVNIEIADRA
jgi:tRNA A-37 threonylcarbamoyl transferase component Bud32